MSCNIENLRQQTKKQNEWLKYKIKNILPAMMEEENIDTWVVIARENNDDPALKSLMPMPMVNGDEGLVMPTTKRWMLLVFSKDEQNSFSAVMIGGPRPTGVEPYELLCPQCDENEWQSLTRYLLKKKPKHIGLNFSNSFSHTDGLKYTELKMLKQYLAPDLIDKIVSAETLCLRWLEYRCKGELSIYPQLIEVSHKIISEAFSRSVVKPGVTSAEDISWWMRHKINSLGLSAWFMPMVSFIRPGHEYRCYEGVVKKGDVLHCDMGVRYYGLLSDTQQLAYILKDGELTAPCGLQNGMKAANDLQDIHMECMVGLQTGNEILANIRRKMTGKGLKGKVWTHPIGYHGHGAGPLIGTYINQDGVPHRGDVLLKSNTCYAMELCVFYIVPEWNNQVVSFNLEETIGFIEFESGEDKAVYFRDRQTSYHLI